MAGLQPEKTTATSGIPVFIGSPDLQPGGLKLVVTGLTAGSLIKSGSPIIADEVERTATLTKTAVVYENLGNTGVAIKLVNKGAKAHQFKSNDVIAAVVGGKAYAGTLVTGTDYDTFTVGTTLGVALTAGDVLFESTAEGASAAALKNTPNAILFGDVAANDGETVAVVVEAYVYENRVPGFTTAMKAALPGIQFSKSF